MSQHQGTPRPRRDDGRPGQSGGGVRRNAQGRERNRGGGTGQRQFSSSAPAQRSRRADPARLVAFNVLRAVSSADAYANLVLPGLIREQRLDRRDAAFATELAYGTLRAQGSYDAILAECVDRPLSSLDPAVLDSLRLGAHQVLGMRVAAHAALDESVSLTRAVIGAGPSGLVNAVLRKVSAHSLDEWLDELTARTGDAVEQQALRYAHPAWVVRAFRQALVGHGRQASEIEELLSADNDAPVVNLVALPALAGPEDLDGTGAESGPLVEDSWLSAGGDLARIDAVRRGVVRVQDVGSQLVARALAAAPVTGGTSEGEQWLDLCAGPGGKAALLAALAAGQGASLLANEAQVHRAELVRKALAPVPSDSWEVRAGDGRDVGRLTPGRFDRVLVDVPCSGLGALRRRPEARWRKTPADVAELGPLQRQLLDSALDATRPGGVVAYVTCSPHLAETRMVVDDAVRKRADVEVIEAGSVIDSVALPETLAAAHGDYVQLWPHQHGTDAMFLALLRKTPTSPATPND
ncbi:MULTISPECIES: transcription antitermination factor NusB [Arthrobacter]|uniref:Transcription antitermination factor NusB n=2 Tax=Arthrobacter TaxID=1663 RepID=A0ABU9KG69_9MICC|nr:transcription antitermination factor NusB [Arthrobacter sp. YJM1]MDP5225897.1 transcription antitermination factor NusB [Arthrobacter sp. YJM1]